MGKKKNAMTTHYEALRRATQMVDEAQGVDPSQGESQITQKDLEKAGNVKKTKDTTGPCFIGTVS
jgi:hypothetical protein